MGVADIDYEEFHYNGKAYCFTVDKDKVFDKGSGNAVCFGRFEKEAPQPLQVGETYCLKVVNAQDPTTEACAARRECYDLMPFEGEHLRQILLQGDSAQVVAGILKEGKRLTRTTRCMIIEPYYYSLQDYFTNCGNYTVRTRLDLVRQFALGSDDLSKDCNKIAGRSILAHRDLKWQNGVAEFVGGVPHVRLVDFATVWVNNMSGGGSTQKASATKKGLVSPENSSPESLLKGFNVNAKTDVYALGMMLASLFMTCDGRYVNPSELWVEENGWDCDEPIARGMERCLAAYETKPDPLCSWIERDLEKKVTWEQFQNEGLLRRIRQLYCSATRIDPVNRISRREFIRTLDGIIKSAADEDCQPVSVYLFNGTDAEQYRQGYQLAAERAFAHEAAETLEQEPAGPTPWALYISYTNPKLGEQLTDGMHGLGETPYSTQADLCSRIGKLESGRASDKDLLLYGIWTAADFLNRHRDRFYFTGNVYLFTPKIPSEQEIKPFVTRLGTVDLQGLCQSTLDQLRGRQTKFKVFTSEEPGPDVADQWEYELVDPNPDPAPDRKNPGPRPEDTGRGYVFDRSPTAPYIVLPDGEQVYVGIIKN